jgi:predicted hydrolase (HD superfamily)
MNIYQLTVNQQALQASLENSGFDEQTIFDTLDGEENTELLREKRLGYVAIIKQKKAQATMRIQAAKDIDALAELDELSAERMEAALFKSMLLTGDIDLIGLEFEAHIKGKTAAVEILDEKLIDAKYWATPEQKPPEKKIRKTLIAADLKAGIAVAGAMFGSDKKLVIK